MGHIEDESCAGLGVQKFRCPPRGVQAPGAVGFVEDGNTGVRGDAVGHIEDAHVPLEVEEVASGLAVDELRAEGGGAAQPFLELPAMGVHIRREGCEVLGDDHEPRLPRESRDALVAVVPVVEADLDAVVAFLGDTPHKFLRRQGGLASPPGT